MLVDRSVRRDVVVGERRVKEEKDDIWRRGPIVSARETDEDLGEYLSVLLDLEVWSLEGGWAVWNLMGGGGGWSS